MFKTNDLVILKKIISHSDYITCLCNLKNNKFASSSFDCSIKIYNIKNYKCECIINAHQKYVMFLNQLKNENILSCSCDKTLKIIKLKKNNEFEISQTLYGHKLTVSFAIELNCEKIISYSKDLTMRIWVKDKKQNIYQCECILSFIKERIFSIHEIINNKNENKVIIYSSNLFFLCLNEFLILKLIPLEQPINNFNVICQIENKFILCQKNSISIYDANFLIKINEIKIDNKIVFISLLKNNTFFIQTENGLLTLCKIEEDENDYEYVKIVKNYNLFTMYSFFLLQLTENKFAISLINEYSILILENIIK